MKHPNYQEFSLRENPSDRAVSTAAAERQVFYAPTGFEYADEEQRIAVYRTVPERVNSNTSIVRLAPWSDDFGRPENALVDAYLAELANATVYSANMPGIDYSKWRDPAFAKAYDITPDQAEELHRNGSFRKIGQAVWRALRGAEKGLKKSYESDDEPAFLFTSSSMAVASLAGVLRAAVDEGGGSSLQGAVIGEGVNYEPRPLLTLAKQFLSGQKHAGGYLAQNPEMLRKAGESTAFWLGRVAAGHTANYAYFRALPRGAFREDIGDLDDFSRHALDVPFLIHSGSASELSPLSHNFKIAAELESHGVDTQQEIYLGHDHPYTMTVSAMVTPVRQLL